MEYAPTILLLGLGFRRNLDWEKKAPLYDPPNLTENANMFMCESLLKTD
jgi:hypothetical protein